MVAIQMYFTRAMESLRSLRDREEGQGLVEYSLILALVSVASIAALEDLSTAINAIFTTIEGALGI
jgi:Flp pilus assembly pilin Flp